MRLSSSSDLTKRYFYFNHRGCSPTYGLTPCLRIKKTSGSSWQGSMLRNQVVTCYRPGRNMPNIRPNITLASYPGVILYCGKPSREGPPHLAFATLPDPPLHSDASTHVFALRLETQAKVSQYCWLQSPSSASPIWVLF